MPHGEKAPDGVIVWFQQSGWMDSNLMKNYVDKYFKDIGINDLRIPKMMVYDSFKGHLEDSVKKKFYDNNFDLAVIPAGLTSICQPLDVAINKPFKDNLRKEWHIWMANGGAGRTAAGNLKRARLSDVCNWVKRSWENISPEIIIQSFKTCGISDSLNEYNIDVKESEKEFEIIDISDGSVDMAIPQAR
jgi:hypothetical protein